jgi:Flp pilus assembly pilin Flp
MCIHSPWIQQALASKLFGLARDRSGQGMVEYVLVIALIALAVVGFLPPVAGALAQLITRISASFQY